MQGMSGKEHRDAPETPNRIPASRFDEFTPRTAKRGHGRRNAISKLAPSRAIPRASGALHSFAFSERIFVARLFRGCSVLRSLAPAVGFSSIWRVRFWSRFSDSWKPPRAGTENVLSEGNSRRSSAPCPALEDDVFAVVTRCPHAASAATKDV